MDKLKLQQTGVYFFQRSPIYISILPYSTGPRLFLSKRRAALCENWSTNSSPWQRERGGFGRIPKNYHASDHLYVRAAISWCGVHGLGPNANWRDCVASHGKGHDERWLCVHNILLYCILDWGDTGPVALSRRLVPRLESGALR